MRRLVLFTVSLVVGAAVMAPLTVGQPVAAVGQASPIETPKRISPEPPPVAMPARLPASAATLPLLTFVVETTQRRPQGARSIVQTITRGSDRVRMSLSEGRQEWLFVQNQVYRDRVSAYLIDHDAREVRFHDEGPLRSRLGIRGWLDVLTIRFDPAILATLRDTGERRESAGVSASRFVAPRSTDDGLVEVWWSEEVCLPMVVTMRVAGVEMTSVVNRLTRGGDPALLADAGGRFPSYKYVDAEDASDH